MTDRHPDDLYDALRDRLADYGQEPPAPLWANIRAQLPPPVAVPQRRRRRRWSPVLLLGLLVAVVGGTFWLWRQNAGTNPLAHRTATPGAPAIRRNRLPASGTGTSTAALPNAVQNAGPQATASSTSSTAVGAAPNSASATGSSDTYAANTAASTDAAATPAGASQAKAKRGVQTGRSQSAVRLLAGQPGAKPRKAGFGTEGTAGEQASTGLMGKAMVENSAFASKTDVGNRAQRRAVQAAAGASATSARSATTQSALPGTGTMASSTSGMKPVGIASRDDSAKTMATQRGLAVASTLTAMEGSFPATTNSPAAAPAQTTRMLGADRVATSPVALQLISVPGPLVHPQPDSAYLPKLLVRRWALLVLAGPALTHRRLDNPTADQVVTPNSTIGVGLPTSRPDSITRRLAQQERQSTGFGVQVQVSRVLNGRWTLSAGLGYQEYASTTKTTETFTNRFMLASTSTITHRDTYQFLTVPVQAHYALGQLGKRLRYGVVAGAEAAIYLSGSNLQLNGVVKDWNAGNSPYRSLNLALSTGLDVRYRVAPRLEMVLQPTATYFMNPLARPAAGLPPRYLWGGSALLGFSYHLR